MLELLARVRARLAAGAYTNEAAVSHGVVTPVLNELGWDSSDPEQMVPEFGSGRGRVDFALMGLGRRPAVFIEVKGIGRAADGDGDRQLFEYAFHEGVPMCVLTDGGEWSFYLPGAQGTYEDRRVYRLRLDERDPEECRSVRQRYLSRERVRSNAAYEDAQRDYRNAAGRREASSALPRAWSGLVAEPEDLLVDLMAERAEALCGFRPDTSDVLAFLRKLQPGTEVSARVAPARPVTRAVLAVGPVKPEVSPSVQPAAVELGTGRDVTFRILGKDHAAANASEAMLTILKAVCARDPAKLPDFAREAEGRSRKHVGRSAAEIYPDRPDLRVAEFHPGWFVGLNIANREKMRLIRTACAVWNLTIPEDVAITLPNAI